MSKNTNQKALLVITGVCTLALAGWISGSQRSRANAQAPLEKTQWTTISNVYYGYSFQVPADWFHKMGVTHDRWTFFSNLTYANNLESHPALPSEGLIAIDFGVDSVADLLPETPILNPALDERGMATKNALIPFLPTGTWTEVKNDISILTVEQPVQEGDGPFTEASTIYILSERMVYYFWIGYAPPIKIDEVSFAHSRYEEVVAHIVESFVIDSEAPVAWRPDEQ